MTERIKTSITNYEYEHLITDPTSSQTLNQPENEGRDRGHNEVREENEHEDHQFNEVEQRDGDDDNENETGTGGLHPMELAAHTVLNGPLDHLNEDFELLGQCQYILLTRLRLIEDRLKSFKKVVIEDVNMTTDKEITETFNKIRELRKRLGASVKSLDKVEERVERMSNKLHLDTNL